MKPPKVTKTQKLETLRLALSSVRDVRLMAKELEKIGPHYVAGENYAMQEWRRVFGLMADKLEEVAKHKRELKRLYGIDYVYIRNDKDGIRY